MTVLGNGSLQIELVKTGGGWPKSNNWCPYVTMEAGTGVVQAQAKGCLGSRQTTEAEAGLELWREQPPTLVSDSFVLSHPACDVTQETVSGTGSQAHGPGLSLGGCPAISVWGVCYAAVSWPLVTIHMPPGEVTVDAATRAPSGAGGCSGAGRSRWAAAPRRGLREVWWGGECWGGHGPLASPPGNLRR